MSNPSLHSGLQLWADYKLSPYVTRVDPGFILIGNLFCIIGNSFFIRKFHLNIEVDLSHFLKNKTKTSNKLSNQHLELFFSQTP